MKGNVFILAMALLCLGGTLFAQSPNYYWSDGEKVLLNEDRSSVVVYFNDQMMPDRLPNPAKGRASLFVNHNRGIIQYDEPQIGTKRQLAAELGLNDSQIRSVSFGWTLNDGFPLWLTHEVVVKPLPQSDLGMLRSLMEQFGATYLRQDFGTHVLDVQDINQVLPLANALQESGLVEWAIPDIYAEVTRHADPLFGQQFQMHNTGQTIDGFSGTNDADCNALEAWNITTGSSSITVAVIDDGVEAHEDLVTSGGASRLVGGYTPANNGNGTPGAGGEHGEACAGIIAASHNGIGVQGVAPEVELLGVNIFSGGESTQDLANAVTWSKNNGADVLSNSWGYNSCTFSASNLTSALDDAASTGRGGKGCVIVFSSGNGYNTCVNYPARVASVIAVGAFGNDGIKSDYSNSGPTLDIIAPSNDVSSQGFLSGAGVRTIDRMGSAGYSSGNYTTSFGGTSASCPVVAGVAALVLSVDPNLTDEQVKNILYTTAKDFGASGFDNLYGNGAVDAFAAVQAAGGSGGGGGGGGGSTCSSTVNSFPYGESFESNEAWTQGSGDDMNWTRRSGGTPSSGTGPSAAADGSFYMYMETSSPNYPTKNAYFESPCFDISGVNDPEFSFRYHMLGSAVGTLRLQASTDGSSWTTIWSLSGDQGSAWNSETVSLSAYASETELRLRFFGTSGTSWQGDMCIDDLGLASSSGGGGGGGGGSSCPAIDFNSYSVTAYGNGQDAGSAAIQDGGATLFLQNNAWKDIAFSYTVTANTVIEFDFRSTIQGEIHGIGFDTDEGISSNRTFKVHGTQNWGITNYDNYSGSSWTTYQIPVGSFYTGNFNRLFFVADHDGGSRNGNAYFRNVKVYEGTCTSSFAPAYVLGNSIQSIMGDEAEYALDIYPSPASRELNVHIEGLHGMVSAQITDLAGKIMWRGTITESEDQVDVSELPNGMYMFTVVGENGNSMTKKFLKAAK